MSSPLSNELFFEAHRGIRGKPDPQYGVGMHFSESKKTAQRFATRSYWEPGTIFHANIPMSSVETNPTVLGQRGYARFSNKDPLGEEEIPVKEGAPIFVTGRTTLRPEKKETNWERKSRTRTYNPPRKMVG